MYHNNVHYPKNDDIYIIILETIDNRLTSVPFPFCRGL